MNNGPLKLPVLFRQGGRTEAGRMDGLGRAKVLFYHRTTPGSPVGHFTLVLKEAGRDRTNRVLPRYLVAPVGIPRQTALRDFSLASPCAGKVPAW